MSPEVPSLRRCECRLRLSRAGLHTWEEMTLSQGPIPAGRGMRDAQGLVHATLASSKQWPCQKRACGRVTLHALGSRWGCQPVRQRLVLPAECPALPAGKGRRSSSHTCDRLQKKQTPRGAPHHAKQAFGSTFLPAPVLGAPAELSAWQPQAPCAQGRGDKGL